MNRQHHVLIAATVAGLALAVAGCNNAPGQSGTASGPQSAAQGGGSGGQASAPQYAEVISATPIRRTEHHPDKSCHDVQVTREKPVKDTHQIAGTAIGAVIGGVLGNQIGGGKGRKIATVAGAIGGGFAGKKIQEHEQKVDTYTTTEQRCQTVDNKRTVVAGYTVKYRYQGQVHTTRMDHDPGRRIEVHQVVQAGPSH